MKPIRFHRKAKREYDETIQYYQDQGPNLGREFQVEFEAHGGQVAQHPDRWPPIGRSSIRKCSLKRFPYAIIYLERPDSVFVIAVAHQKRRPFYWQDRI